MLTLHRVRASQDTLRSLPYMHVSLKAHLMHGSLSLEQSKFDESEHVSAYYEKKKKSARDKLKYVFKKVFRFFVLKCRT